MTIYVDLTEPADGLRQALYEGNLVILTDLTPVAELVDYARDELTRLFEPYDPQEAHEHFDKNEMAAMLGSWKPKFIHSSRSKQLVCEIIRAAGLSADDTYYDVPKPRTSFPVGHLTTGIAYAFPWHRDVWYSAPSQQINWWLPIFPVRDDNAMSFDLPSFDRPVPNTSDTFDYYENNIARKTTAAQVTEERQARPAAPDHHPANHLPVLPAPGAVLLFSGAHLHTSIPNTSQRSRYSVDFRTVDVTDLRSGRGAPVVDARCSGTAVRDFHRVADEQPLDEGLVRELYGAPPAGSVLVFSSSDSDA
jgi:ectoine hydroxylase-related dioxygenase (phytanoyl-CoA dioxygenase family)